MNTTMSDDTKSNRVRFARASQRRHHRLITPLGISVNGVTYTALDWSMEGLRFRPAHPDQFNREDRIDLSLSIPFQGFNVTLDLKARVIRVDASTGDVALQLIELSSRAKELLHYFSDNLIRGEMASIEGTIKRLDLPVTPPPPKTPDSAAKEPAQTRRRSWLVGSSYVFLGAFLAIALVYTFYVNLFFVPSEQALLYTPTVDLIAPEDGTVAAVYVSEGERIAEGDPLLQVKSPQLERLLSEARIQVREAEIAQQRLTDLIATESGAIDTYRLIASDQVAATSARLSAAQKQLSLLEHQHARVFQLFQQGMVSSQEMDRIEADQYRARQAVAEVQADLRIARAAREAAQTGKYYSSNRFEGRLPELKDELAAAKSQVELAKTRLMELERQSDQLTLRAPGSGHVRQIPVVAGNAIKGGMLAISLLTDQTPKVYARVPSDQLAQIALGDDARVFVPALSREFTARVVAVEPRLWSLPENLRRLLGEPGEGGLAVLALAPGELDTSSLQPGLPVSVELRNETGRQAMHQLASLLNLIEPNAAAEPLPASAARYSGVDTNVNAR